MMHMLMLDLVGEMLPKNSEYPQSRIPHHPTPTPPELKIVVYLRFVGCGGGGGGLELFEDFKSELICNAPAPQDWNFSWRT